MGDSCAFAFTAGRRMRPELEERESGLKSCSADFRLQKTSINMDFLNSYAEEHDFPQVFAQVWKSLGGDQIPYALPTRSRS